MARATTATGTTKKACEWAEAFHLLGHPVPMQIMLTLADNGQMNAKSLAEAVGVRQTAISHHLQRLRMGTLVTSTRQGQWVFYRVNGKALADLEAAIRAMRPKR